MNRIELEALMHIINYIKEDEQKHYEECEEPDTMHIWNDIKVLMDYAQAHQFTLENLEEQDYIKCNGYKIWERANCYSEDDEKLASERRRDKAGQDADWTNDSGYSDVFDKGGSWENEPQPEDDLPF